MPEFLKKILAEIIEIWNKMATENRRRLYLISAVLVVSIAAFIILLTRSSMVPLLTDIDSEERGNIVAVLKNAGINPKLEENGKTILVDKRQLDSAQVALSVEGYPKSGMTFSDAFNMIKINNTESDKSKLWEEQEKQSIRRKIKMLKNVREAEVELTLPEPDVFLTEEQKSEPKGWVMVETADRLSQKQVRGIANLVAAAVKDMSPDDVYIVDSNGNPLSKDISDPITEKASSQEEARQLKTTELKNKVYNFFARGSDSFDSISVEVNPVLDFNTQTTQVKKLSKPEGMDTGALTDSQTKTERIKENQNPKGAAGTASNPGTGTITYQTGDNNGSDYSNNEDSSHYEYNQEVTNGEKAIGVLLPEQSSMGIALWYGRNVTDETKLSDAFIKQVKDDASKMTGIPVSNISVSKYKLLPKQIPSVNTLELLRQLFNDYGFYALMLVLIISLLFIAMPRKKQYVKTPVLAEAETAAATATGFVTPETAAARYAAIMNEKGEILPEIDLEERSEVKKQIEKFVKQRPDAVAQLLRNWLSDDWE